jgi:hypothetical protein
VRSNPYSRRSIAVSYAEQRIGELRYKLHFTGPKVFWRLVAGAIETFVSHDRALQRAHDKLSALEQDELPLSCDWLRHQWLDRAFSERYWSLLGDLTSQECGQPETLIAWRHLFADINSVYAFSKHPEPFDRQPIGCIREELDRRGHEIYHAMAQVGFRLYSERWRGVFLRRLANRWSAQAASSAVNCIDLLDALRRTFLLVVRSPFYSDEEVDTT